MSTYKNSSALRIFVEFVFICIFSTPNSLSAAQNVKASPAIEKKQNDIPVHLSEGFDVNKFFSKFNQKNYPAHVIKNSNIKTNTTKSKPGNSVGRTNNIHSQNTSNLTPDIVITNKQKNRTDLNHEVNTIADVQNTQQDVNSGSKKSFNVFQTLINKLRSEKNTKKNDVQVKAQPISLNPQYNDLQQLLFKYGVLEKSIGPDVLYNPKYLEMSRYPDKMIKEIEKSCCLKSDQTNLKVLLDAKIHQIAKSLLTIDKKYSILKNNQTKLLYDIVIMHNAGSMTHSINNIIKLDEIIQHVPTLAPSKTAKITSHFGPRQIGKRPVKMHTGIDIVHSDRKIYAAASGIVKSTQKVPGYGNLITLQHLNCITKYAHVNKFFVSPGEYVKQGHLIAIEGATGNAMGRHCHMEMKTLEGKFLDPSDFLVCSLGKDLHSQPRLKRDAALAKYANHPNILKWAKNNDCQCSKNILMNLHNKTVLLDKYANKNYRIPRSTRN